FEQCLQNRAHCEQTIVPAIRQCDGDRLQAIVLVRDEFWMAAVRFFDELDLQLGTDNSLPVDRFSPAHARVVLEKLGQVVDCLPASDQLTADQQRFLEVATESLTASDGRVSPIHLSLFVDMLRESPWTPPALRNVGNWEGIGVAFLQKSLGPDSAPPHRRRCLREIKSILRCLLPPEGEHLRARPRSRAEVIAAAGLADPVELDRLLRILDTELRLVTTVHDASVDEHVPNAIMVHYQLTHDLLVPSIRQWLNREEQGTFRGRARTTLRERAAYWQADPSKRQLPSLVELVRILAGTTRAHWQPAERKLIRQSMRHHAVRWGAMAIVGMLAVNWWTTERSRVPRQQMLNTVRQLRTTRLERIPAFIDELVANPDLSLSVLREQPSLPPAWSNTDWVAIAQLRLDGRLTEQITATLLHLNEDELVIAQQIFGDALPTDVEETLRKQLEEADTISPAEQLRALSLLDYCSKEPLTLSTEVATRITEALLAVPPARLPQWLRNTERNREELLPLLMKRFIADPNDQVVRASARIAIRAFAHDRQSLLAELAVRDDDDQLPMHVQGLESSKALRATLHTLLDESVSGFRNPLNSPALRDDAAKQAVRAAAVSARFGDLTRVLPLLRRQADPTLRVRLIDGFAPLGVDARIVADQLLTQDTDPGIRAALIMMMGRYELSQLPAHLQPELTAILNEFAQIDEDPEVHSAAMWLKRRWSLPAASTVATEASRRGWFEDSLGFTMVIFAPGEFAMGTADDEPERTPAEIQHSQTIARQFALATTEVTIAQYDAFLTANGRQNRKELAKVAPSKSCPQTLMSWHDAARYCNWLSESAGIARSQWCYEPVSTSQDATMQAVADATMRRGYRMPTEAEWEYACRAGTTTPRFCGTIDLLNRYAWCAQPTSTPLSEAGRLLPNPAGLFDIYGNALEWCHDGPTDDSDSQSSDSNDSGRLCWQRGGHNWQAAKLVRSAIRYSSLPGAINFTYGLRVARTVPADGT
ncbi:MAG: formylglycine-generating enzyme family protein, partial [Planctomycetales bacterium]|nr:formylglycine-generating enzyme family protein [Planctomycetales bacterium]